MRPVLLGFAAGLQLAFHLAAHPCRVLIRRLLGGRERPTSRPADGASRVRTPTVSRPRGRRRFWPDSFSHVAEQRGNQSAQALPPQAQLRLASCAPGAANCARAPRRWAVFGDV